MKQKHRVTATMLTLLVLLLLVQSAIAQEVTLTIDKIKITAGETINASWTIPDELIMDHTDSVKIEWWISDSGGDALDNWEIVWLDEPFISSYTPNRGGTGTVILNFPGFSEDYIEYARQTFTIDTPTDSVPELIITAMPRRINLSSGEAFVVDWSISGGVPPYNWEAACETYGPEYGFVFEGYEESIGDVGVYTHVPSSSGMFFIQAWDKEHRCISFAVDYTVDTSSPQIPPPVITSTTANGTSITLNWAPVSEADSYEVYRMAENGTYIKVTISETSYTDSDLIPGRQYTYTVRAKNDSVVSEQSNSKTLMISIDLPKAEVTQQLGNKYFGYLTGDEEWFDFWDASLSKEVYEANINSGFLQQYKNINNDVIITMTLLKLDGVDLDLPADVERAMQFAVEMSFNVYQDFFSSPTGSIQKDVRIGSRNAWVLLMGEDQENPQSTFLLYHFIGKYDLLHILLFENVSVELLPDIVDLADTYQDPL